MGQSTWNLAARLGRVARWNASLVVAGLLAGSVNAPAQTLTMEFAEGNLAPAAQEMAAAGVDGSTESLATIIEIAQRHGFGYGISPDEVRALVGGGYLVVRQIDCSSLADGAARAQRLSRTLSMIAWLYAAGAGLTVVMPPVAGILGFGALVTGIASTAAGWLAADYRERRVQAKCTKGGTLEWFRQTAPVITAAVGPAIWRYSWQRWCGASACA
jgi:hypothetical protein